MSQPGSGEDETYNPWSVVNLVFRHLAAEGLHPILGDGGDPGAPASELLRSLGVRPAAEGNRQVSQRVQDDLAEIRAAFFEDERAMQRSAACRGAPDRAGGTWRQGLPGA